MNLKTFNATNATKRGKAGRYFFRTHLGNGQCQFSPDAVRLLDLRERDMIAIHQDKEDSEIWYIEKVAAHGIKVKKVNPNELGFYSAILLREIYDSIVFTGHFGKIGINPEPVQSQDSKLYRLDLSNLKND